MRFSFCDCAYGKPLQTAILSLLRHQALLLHAGVCGLHHWLLRDAARTSSEQGRNETEQARKRHRETGRDKERINREGGNDL